MYEFEERNMDAFFDLHTKEDQLEEMFGPILILKDQPEHVVVRTIQSRLAPKFASMNQDPQDSVLKNFVAYLGRRAKADHVERLFRVLEALVADNTVSARSVCEALLFSPTLTCENGVFWIESFELISRIIGGVDYKGVREIMKAIIDKSSALPKRLTAWDRPMASALKRSLDKILDRDACLLPGYFVINEILKAYPTEKDWPHWIVAESLSKFIASFRPCAQMVSTLGRSGLLPVVDNPCPPTQGGVGVAAWKLDSTTLRFTTRGNLPYSRDYVDGQGKLLRHVLSQLYSRDMVCCMLGLQKQVKQRSPALEKEMVNLILEAMSKCPDVVSPSMRRAKKRFRKSLFGGRKRGRDDMEVDKETGEQNARKKAKMDGSVNLDGGSGGSQSGLDSGLHSLLVDDSGDGLDLGDLGLGMGDGGVKREGDFEGVKREIKKENLGNGELDSLCEDDEDDDDDEDESGVRISQWQHLSTQLIYFVLFQFASFPAIVSELHRRLALTNCRRGRDHLMWVLLQFISGSIQKNPTSDFFPVIRLYDLLYPEEEPLPVPNVRRAVSCHKMAPVCIWIHLMKKAGNESIALGRTLPRALSAHHAFLQGLVTDSSTNLAPATGDFRVALLCNAFSTNQDYFPRPMGALVEAVHAMKVTTPMPGNNCAAGGPAVPLSMDILDALTVHAKMSLIHNIVTHVIKLAQAQSKLALAPALVETYSRLLVYMEIESLGIKGFISQVLPNVFKCQSWGILHTLLEIFSFRLHHIQPHYRVQLLSQLHSLANVPYTSHTQMHLCVESTALRLIVGLGNTELQMGGYVQRCLQDPKPLISTESEELNRVMVLTLARAIHIHGADFASGSIHMEILSAIMANTPLSWPSHTLNCFPPGMADFFAAHPVNKDHKHQIKKQVEEEYKKWISMTNEKDLVGHFSLATNPPHLFLCLLWKIVMETEQLNPIAYKVLERVGAKALASHLRTFCDYFVHEFSLSGHGAQVNRCIDGVSDLIWKYHVFPIDRFILCLALRNIDGNEKQVCFLIIQLLLLKSGEWQSRVKDFLRDNSPEHWKMTDWHQRHLRFHSKYPETFAPEGLLDQNAMTLPIYFGNVCLRFLPVFDIVIHRYLEIEPMATITKTLDNLLDSFGGLYRFHDRPITFLYNTLHYYEKRLRDRPELKRHLVAAVLGYETGPQVLQQSANRSATNRLSSGFMVYLASEDPANWTTDLSYYVELISNFVKSIDGENEALNSVDWRFNEFPNPGAHALNLSLVELMTMGSGEAVGEALLDVVLRGSVVVGAVDELERWVNAVGLLFAGLPRVAWVPPFHRRILRVLGADGVARFPPGRRTPFDAFNARKVHPVADEREGDPAYLLAVAHAVLTHVPVGYFDVFLGFIRDELEPTLTTEEQLIWVYHLFGPLMKRVHVEWTRCLGDMAIVLYQLLLRVDKALAGAELKYLDQFVDVLYHVKYMFTGDMVKAELDGFVRQMSAPLRRRLRFITHLSEEGPGNPNPAGGRPPSNSMPHSPFVSGN